jgi:hypothetical protein
MKDHPPPKVRSRQAFLDDLDRQVTAALADDRHRAFCVSRRSDSVRSEASP